MTAVAYVGPRVPESLRRYLRRRPEAPASLVVGGAWLIVAVTSFGGLSHDAGGAATMPGMAMPMRVATQHATSSLGTAVAGLPGWCLMVIAMMGPAALSGVRHTGLNSLPWRRSRAMTEFAITYLTCWMLFGLVALWTVALLPSLQSTAALAAALLVAGVWQLTAWKRRWLRDCHRSVPLRLTGWRAELCAARFGARNGLACVGSCWAMMLVMVVAPSGQLLWMAALGGVVTTERLMERPRRATRTASVLLLIASAAFAGTLLL